MTCLEFNCNQFEDNKRDINVQDEGLKEGIIKDVQGYYINYIFKLHKNALSLHP
jgi:hypothetical protein